MYIINSIIYKYREYKKKFFHLTKEGKELKKLRNIHQGKRCFIIGNGPSLICDDLDKLSISNEISFAFNRIYHIFDRTNWRPTYYISQDEKLLSNSINEISSISIKKKFIPIELKWDYNIKIKDALHFHLEHSNMNEKPAYSNNIAKGIINSRTVVYSAIQMATYMGIKEIYLIGVDHHFHTSMNNEGKIIIDANAKDYFSEKYNNDKESLYIPNTEMSTLAFISAKEYAKTHNINIYNATRGGKLEVFPRINFDSLF